MFIICCYWWYQKFMQKIAKNNILELSYKHLVKYNYVNIDQIDNLFVDSCW